MKAFQSLITIHILFAKEPTSGLTAAKSPLAPLVLQMDERLQHQCTGFIQAEAESFAEQIEERDAAERDSSPSNDGENSDDDEEAPVKAAYRVKKGKGKPPVAPKRDIAADLAGEYTFISVVSYFLRAIVPGAIDVRHSAVLLAYYGRLGTQFDLCLSTIVGVLREEGMYKKNGALVEQIVCDAARQVSSPLVESTNSRPLIADHASL